MSNDMINMSRARYILIKTTLQSNFSSSPQVSGDALRQEHTTVSRRHGFESEIHTLCLIATKRITPPHSSQYMKCFHSGSFSNHDDDSSENVKNKKKRICVL